MPTFNLDIDHTLDEGEADIWREEVNALIKAFGTRCVVSTIHEDMYLKDLVLRGLDALYDERRRAEERAKKVAPTGKRKE